MNKENARAFIVGFEAGEAVEQERIVRLLEAQDSVSGAWAIALIRGEKMTDQDRFEHIENVRDMYRDQGVERERERIIKLLEELKEYWSEKVEFEYGTVSAINVDEAIALIKGDKSE